MTEYNVQFAERKFSAAIRMSLKTCIKLTPTHPGPAEEFAGLRVPEELLEALPSRQLHGLRGKLVLLGLCLLVLAVAPRHAAVLLIVGLVGAEMSSALAHHSTLSISRERRVRSVMQPPGFPRPPFPTPQTRRAGGL